MKICNKCKETLDESLFNKCKSNKDGLDKQCRKCTKARAKKHYQNIKIKKCLYNSKYRKAYREKNKRFIARIKRLGCSKCSEKSPECIDFHHLDKTTKYKELAWLVQKGYRLEVIKTEIRKCIRVCANCHRKIHAGTLII